MIPSIYVEIVVTYRPIGDEPDLDQGIPAISARRWSRIPMFADDDPVQMATLLTQLHQNKQIGLVIPGRIFDAYGTRHGRGGGWYDRLLSHVPSSWTRIGVCSESQFTQERLIRKSWDEPVDWIAIKKKNGAWHVVETRARPLHRPLDTDRQRDGRSDRQDQISDSSM